MSSIRSTSAGLNKHHWKILSLLRKLSDKISIIWVCGNHDGPADAVSHLLGVRVKDEHQFTSGRLPILVLHGHQFDEFISTYPTVTFFADVVYRFLQWIDRSHRFARFAKSNTKIFLRCIEKIRLDAIAYATARGARIVCCGHTHHAEQIADGSVTYVNGGCWTESPPTYLTVRDGVAAIHTFADATPAPAPEKAHVGEIGIAFLPSEFVLN